GLQEKVSTAWEFRQQETNLAIQQREDALRSLRKNLAEIRASIVLWPSSKRQATLLGCLSLAWLVLLIYPLDESIQIKLAEQKAVTKIEKELEEEIKETEQNEQLRAEDKEKLANLLE